MTRQAEAAKLIRKELKQKFREVAFFVRSRSFAGGTSIDIEWTDGPCSKEVNEIILKYQYGKFDASIDLYEMNNYRKDIPQVKYIHLKREISEIVFEQKFQDLKKTHIAFDKVEKLNDTSDELMKHWGFWTAREYIRRQLVETSL